MEETNAAQSAPDAKCKAIGALVVGGRQVGWLRCSLEAGHADMAAVFDETWRPHRQVLEWADDPVQLADWPEAYDPDERFDAEVPLTDVEG